MQQHFGFFGTYRIFFVAFGFFILFDTDLRAMTKFAKNFMSRLEEEIEEVLKTSEALLKRADRFLVQEKLYVYKLKGLLDPKKRRRDLKKYFE